jgi:hypothetical protein
MGGSRSYGVCELFLEHGQAHSHRNGEGTDPLVPSFRRVIQDGTTAPHCVTGSFYLGGCEIEREPRTIIGRTSHSEHAPLTGHFSEVAVLDGYYSRGPSRNWQLTVML